MVDEHLVRELFYCHRTYFALFHLRHNLAGKKNQLPTKVETPVKLGKPMPLKGKKRIQR